VQVAIQKHCDASSLRLAVLILRDCILQHCGELGRRIEHNRDPADRPTPVGADSSGEDQSRPTLIQGVETVKRCRTEYRRAPAHPEAHDSSMTVPNISS
jgi:hypothetical protein